MKTIKAVMIFVIILISSFITLYVLIEPMVQSAYQKGYELGLEQNCDIIEQPVINPFGEFEINQNWTMGICCYPSDCPESKDNPEDCTCIYPIYCKYNLS